MTAAFPPPHGGGSGSGSGSGAEDWRGGASGPGGGRPRGGGSARGGTFGPGGPAYGPGGPAYGPGAEYGPGGFGPADAFAPGGEAGRHSRPSVYEQLRADPRMARLRAARRRPLFRVTGTVTGLYLLTALLANHARDLMGAQIAGPLNVGLLLGLAQCATTVWAALWYARYARTELDPDADRLRVVHQGQGNTR
ncbi:MULTISPECIES: DUF485 domain-containing protein [Streptomyces]|uniref:DUF485 domain-containing protein n=1 Tax=Streptomyces xinghaiensis TaxID=1038928 RepID=A0A420V9D7_9ACTN|nr:MULTISPECIES: DUF485 domain-containing protein [Streptomyces]PQM24910.1 DUF485 domain-containing protein [Streptomyces xinghaiensis]RKM98961.1 DUF485 domain-containing protein [Streptomyces xinghaiensis]RNC76137.1 DUF485 domain-containing protein [Streptomyces xinghaiensis]